MASLSEITREAVEKAIAEYRDIGREEFLRRYGFAKGISYFLRDNGELFDSKAIVGAAYKFIAPDFKPLRSTQFTGGRGTVQRHLERLGFEVVAPSRSVKERPKPGESISNIELMGAFGVGQSGGMRRNTRGRLLVLISDPSKGLYHDRWEGKVLHYTGMGRIGDQTLDGTQNRTLRNAASEGTELHLFEVFEPGRYTYQGRVTLVGAPYQESQEDLGSAQRKVWIFPLSLVEDRVPPAPLDALRFLEREAERHAQAMSLGELKKRAENAPPKPGRRVTQAEQIQRNPFVSAYAKKAAGGRCDLCAEQAPFTDTKGFAFLECHHIEHLAKGGLDVIENTVALCPNCHRKMHVLNRPADRRQLLYRVLERAREK